jgi:hypothetical protein
MIGREKRVVALEQYLSQARNYDPVLDGLRRRCATTRPISTRSSHRCCRCWRSSPAARSPSFWRRTTPTWPTRARSSIGCRSSESAIVYVGLDALSDAEVAAAVGNSMFSDLVSVAGHIYKHGIDDGLPGASAGARADQRPCRRIQ